MRRVSTFLLGVAASALVQIATAPAAFADPILGNQLASFAVLGSSTVTNVPTSDVVGNVGVWSSGGANAITGFNSSPGVAVDDPQVTDGQVHAGTSVAHSAQGQLTGAISFLGLLGPGTTLDNPDLSGLTLTPGIHTVPAGVSNLTTSLGALTLDGQDDVNAFWVFHMESTLITSPDSVVNVINTGAGAGLFWNVRSSATLDTSTSLLGNILPRVTPKTDASIGCGRALSSTGAVTQDMNAVGLGCDEGTGGEGSNGFNGGGPESPIPEPGTLLLLGTGIAGVLARRARSAI
jgi:hypothetical protein